MTFVSPLSSNPLSCETGKPQCQGGSSSMRFEAFMISYTETRTTKISASEKSDVLNVDFGSVISKLIDDLFDNLTKSRGAKAHGISVTSTTTTSVSIFSAEFESTFGLTGPLPNFIERVTKDLGLTAEQNLALQNISISNKDIVKTPANVQKVAEQLAAAGIGAPKAAANAVAV